MCRDIEAMHAAIEKHKSGLKDLRRFEPPIAFRRVPRVRTATVRVSPAGDEYEYLSDPLSYNGLKSLKTQCVV